MMPLARLLATTAALALAFPVHAQDLGAAPTYATLDLETGFPDDPNLTAISAGGQIDASTINEGCVGYIANAPDVRLNYTAGSLPLYIYAMASADTTLVVNGPDGQWYCDDDGLGDLSPMVSFDAPQSGQYDIWVGVFGDRTTHSAELYVSELASSVSPGGGFDEAHEEHSEAGGIDFGAEPNFGQVDLVSGFTPDPYGIDLQSGGENDASQLGEPCTGFISGAPDFRLNYESGSLPLYIRTQSDHDTTLAVNAPDGQWYCDDDSAGAMNAQVWFDNPQSGQYDIFVGTFGSSDYYDTRLEISEVAQN